MSDTVPGADAGRRDPGRLRALVVDDEPPLVRIVSGYLEREVGADDYVTKPFSPRVLVARIRAMLRRPRVLPAQGGGPVRRFGDPEIDPAGREAGVGGRPVELTRTEFDLLDALSAEPRVAFSRRRLMERVWGGDWYGDEHVVDVHVANLRRKLGDDAQQPRYVRTVRGIGYRMGPP